MADELSLSKDEIDLYCWHLTGKNADEKSKELFARAILHEATVLNTAEVRLLEFILKNRWSVACVDAALGMFHPKHKLRKRMIIAFAILETNPVYYDFFAPKKLSSFYLFNLGFQAVKDGTLAVIGSIILLIF